MVIDYESTLSPEMLQKAYEELGEDEQQRVDSVIAIQEWLKEQPHLQSVPTDTQFLLNFLRRCKFSTEETKNKLEMVMTLRNRLPEFSGWSPMSPDIQAALSVGLTLPLPGHDQLGRKIYLFRAACYDPNKISQESLNRTSLMITEIFMSEDEAMHITGVVIIFDFTNFTLKHLINMDLAAEKRLAPIWDNFLQPKSIHYINTPSVFNAAMRVFTPFLKEETKKKNKIHGNDKESLFKEFPKDVIPKDFGGNGMSCAELTSMWKKKCEDKLDWLKERELIKADESKRRLNVETEGSFCKRIFNK